MITLLLITSIIINNKEIFNYLIVGFLTTVISIVSYFLLRIIIDNYLICSAISWIIAVSFAYFTNRKYVFNSKNENIVKESISFTISRILSLILELILMYSLVEFIKISDGISKIIVQVIVIIANYILSKFIVFKH